MNKLTRVLFFILFLSPLSSIGEDAAAQNKEVTVSGTVKDSQNSPIPGATVSIVGTKIGTVTDLDGVYSLKLSARNSQVLKYECLGYESVALPVSGSVMDVVLKEANEMLDEVVVVGYGTIRKSDMVGSSAAMKTEHLSEIKAYSFEQAMQGRLAGVVVSGVSGEPGAAINISVRGASSINGSNQPLFVIDGVPMDNIGEASEYDGGSGFNVMSLVNPNDIESIEVLKDASSTAIYGSRGANGVVMVTTKQGKKGSVQINLNINHSVSWSNKYYDLVDGQEYAQFINEGYHNTYPNRSEKVFPDYGYFLNDYYVSGMKEVGEGTNWQKIIRRVAHSGNYQFSINGGSEKVSYFISGGANLEEGIILKNDYDKYNIRGNFKAKMNDWLSAKFSLSAFTVNASRTSSSTNTIAWTNVERNGSVFKALWASPLLPYDHQVYKITTLVEAAEFGVTGTVNPYLDLMNETYHNRSYSCNANLDLIFTIIKNLSFTLRGNTTLFNDINRHSWNANHQNAWKVDGRYTNATADTFKYGMEAFFNYSMQKNNHSVSAAAGVSAEKSGFESEYYELTNYTVAFDEFEHKDAYALSMSNSTPDVGAYQRVLLSAYGRVNYSYKDRYLINATFRTDGASVFATKRKWAFFPSFGLGWTFSREGFMNNLNKVISLGKLRFSYGTAGNQAINPYQSLSSLETVRRPDSNNDPFMGFREGSHPTNHYLTWETTTQANLGLDLKFFDKITMAFDIYSKKTNNLLQTITIPAQTGYTSYVGNLGAIGNKGIELELGANIINKKDLFLDLKFTFTHNKGKILDLGQQSVIDYFVPAFGSNCIDPSHRIVVGGTIGDFFGLKTDGLLSPDDIESGYPTYRQAKAGMLKYVDSNNDGVITLEGDGQILGNANPDFVAGFEANMGYKNLSLSLLFNAAVGQKILNLNKLYSDFGNWRIGRPSKAYMNDHYSEQNPNAYYPIPEAGNGMAICDRLVEDASFLRLSNVTLRYSLPRIKKLSSLKTTIFVTGSNLFLLTNYSGYDPEVSAYGKNVLRAGIDQGVYPRPRSVTFGLDINF